MNTLYVLVDGAVSGTYFLTGGAESYEIGAYYGQVISFQYNVAGSGNWAGENSYAVIDASGNEVAYGNSTTNADSLSCAPPPLDCLYTLTLNDQYSDGWTNSDGSMNTLDVLVDGAVSGTYFLTGGTESYEIGAYYGQVISFQYNVAGSGNWAGENSYVVTDASGNEVSSGNSTTNADSLSCSSDPVPAMELQGIGDLDIPSSGGKFVHLVATADIADLSVYGLGMANNGGGTDELEWSFPEGLSALSGDQILLYRDLDVVNAYMDASNTFDLLLEAPAGSTSPVSSNGNDALELYFYGAVIEIHGDLEFEGGSSNYDHSWAFNDSWAYKVDGVWTYGGPNCSDDEWDNGPISACDSSCPYPFNLDACPFVPSVIEGAACLDFEGEAAADGWRFQDITGNDSAWEIDDSPVLNGEGSLGHSYFPTDVAFVDVAVSPTFNTLAMTDARLRYSEYMNYSGDGINNVVYYTLDDPATLDAASANVVALDVGINADAEDVWVERVFDLPEAENVTLLFLYQGTFGHSWNIDDMCVEEVPPPPFHDVTFNLDARNIIVANDGIYMGGGIFGSAQGVAMSDDDGDGIWTAVVNLQEGTTGEFIFLNSPGDGGDYGGRTENLADTACATGQYNDRAIPAFDADNLVFNYCFSVCNDTNTGCAEAVTRHDVSITVGTANIEVGEGGMYLGGGIMGHAKAFAMTNNGDDTHSVTVSVPEGLSGNYTFLNNPSNHYWYDGKEDIGGLECADADNNNDRLLEAVTGPTSVQFCYGTCDTECAAPNNGIAEFPACFDFEGEAGLEGWSFLDLADGTVGWELASASTSSSAFEGGQALYHGYLPGDVNYSGLAISPQFNTSDMTDAQLSYTEFVQWGSDGQDAVVWVSTDEVLSLESENLTIVAQGISADGYTDQVIDLPEADYVTVIFHYIGTYGHSWAIDDMCVEETPAEPNFVTADPNNAWGGYMEVFEVNAEGGAGNFVFGQPWGVADLQTTLQPDVPNMILEPNVNAYNAEDPFWSNGELGNKIMRATTQVESWENYNGADLTFTGSVAEHTLEGYDTVYFIKCLDPDNNYSDMLEAAYVLPLPDSGEFSVSVSGDLLPAGKLVQFGFAVVGLNANPASDYGKVVIGDVGLSIGENDSLDMVIYPNPVDGDYVTIQTPLNGDKLVEVFDVNGRKVMERLLTTNTLNVGSISAGMYIVKVTVEGQSNVSKLIIE
jgi:hypothetical protein